MAERLDDYGVLINVRRTGLREAQYKELTAKRGLIRRAFDRVRYSPNDNPVMETLLRALTGKSPITETVLETAHQVIKDSQRP
jgi:hypothetical protein